MRPIGETQRFLFGQLLHATELGDGALEGAIEGEVEPGEGLEVLIQAMRLGGGVFQDEANFIGCTSGK